MKQAMEKLGQNFDMTASGFELCHFSYVHILFSQVTDSGILQIESQA